jgi:hypothetical protein
VLQKSLLPAGRVSLDTDRVVVALASSGDDTCCCRVQAKQRVSLTLNEKKRFAFPAVLATALTMFGVGACGYIYFFGTEDGPDVAVRNAATLLNGRWTVSGVACGDHPLTF